MMWLTLLISASVSWAIHNIFLKMVGETMPPSIVAACFYVFAILTNLALYLFSPQKSNNLAQQAEIKFLIPLILAGVTIGLVDFFYVTALSKGAPLSLAGPFFSVLSLVLISASGVLFFAESITLFKATGMILAIIGILMVAK